MLLCSNSIIAQDPDPIMERTNTLANIEKSVDEIIADSGLSAEVVLIDEVQQYTDSASLQLIDMQKKLRNMKVRNFLRWIGSVILIPLSSLLAGVMVFASVFSGSKTVATLYIFGGCSVVAGSVMLLISAIKHQNQIKKMKNKIKIMEQRGSS